MTAPSKTTVRYLPQVRYGDVEGTARWLCHALGFSVHSAVRNPEGVMDYVHLTHGPANVVIKPLDLEMAAGASGDDDAQSHYIYVNDVAGHYATAVAEGAQIVTGLRGMPRLGQGYSCRDVEGQLWTFGSFDPWQVASVLSAAEAVSSDPIVTAPVARAEEPIAPVPSVLELLPEPHIRRASSRATPRSLMAALAVGGIAGALVVAAVIFWNDGASLSDQVAAERLRREQSEAATQRANQALAGERSAKEQFQHAAMLIESELATAKAQQVEHETQLQAASSELSLQAGAVRDLQTEKAAIEAKMSEAEKQWHAVEASLTQQLDDARATAATAQSEHAALEATLTQRVFTLETSLRDEKVARGSAEAARTAADLELAEARKGRRKAEAALQTALAGLTTERLARVEAEERADKLRGQLAARRAPARKVARAKVPAKVRPIAAAKAKSATVPKLKTSNAYSVDDLGFQP